jgi:predicted RNA methylase
MELITSDNDGLPLRSRCVDTVLTNPPFGTKNNAGMDLRFLRAATRLARTSVYSFHKTSTRDFVSRVVNHWGMNVEVVAQMKFDLPQTYKFHKEKSVDVEVDLIRVAVFPDEERAEEE